MKHQFYNLKSRICSAIADTNKLRYLIAGSWNTFFGYIVGLAIYYGLNGRVSVIVVGVMANVLAISMAFLSYKLFVFQTKGNWVREYFRAYAVYGATSIIGISLLWCLVDGIGLPFWLGQGLAIILTVIVSYTFHSRYTFRVAELKDELPQR